MDSILNISVSCFANYDTPDNPKPVNLLSWLKSDKYRNEVEKIRLLQDKAERDRIKATLPAITPSGVFIYRSVKDLVRHSGFIQFDIDAKGNESVGNYADLKEQISKIKNVAYCGLSVSGTGYWGLIPIAYPEKHVQHHKVIQEALKKFGISIDPAPKSVASLRGYSFDPNAFFNHQAVVFENYYSPPPSKPLFVSGTNRNSEWIFNTAGKMIDSAPDGQKWHQLSKASYLMGGYAGAGFVDPCDAISFLKSRIEAQKGVKSLQHAYKTIEKCFSEGLKSPIYNSFM